MALTHKYCFTPCLGLLRIANHHSAAEVNHYKTLGLSPSATKADIKAAYYELSKKHHPDRNQGSDESTKIFRRVKAAYEVLGNEQKRMQYDKDRIFKDMRKPPVFYDNPNPDYQYEAERSHFRKSRNAFKKQFYGKTAHYDFDAWYDGHYGKDRTDFYEFRERRQYREPEFSTVIKPQYKNVAVGILGFLFLLMVYCTLKVSQPQIHLTSSTRYSKKEDSKPNS